MVAKKSEKKEEKKKTLSPKKATPKKAVVAKKVAISTLKTEVKKNKDKKDKVVKKEKKIDKKEEVKSEKNVSEQVKIKTAAIFKKKTQNEGKIGEIKNNVARATGHRKRAIAKVFCQKKSGGLEIIINNLDYKKFFTRLVHQNVINAPFKLLKIDTGYSVKADVFGGGKSGQADAFKLGLSRCLSLFSDENAKILRKNSFLTRDARKVEPKKAGLKKARKKEQFSKR